MLGSPLMVSVRVPDMQNAREWYGRALGQEPVFAAPFATAFRTGGDSLLLLLSTSAEDERSVAYFNVDDIETAYQHLLDAGATPRSEITFTMLGSRMARVVDPFGNVLGV